MKNPLTNLLVSGIFLLLTACAVTGEAAPPPATLTPEAVALPTESVPAPAGSSATAEAVLSSKDAAPAEPTVTPHSPALTVGTPVRVQPEDQTRDVENPDLNTGFWENLPVIPLVGERPREIYQRGLELGNNAHAYSKIGDCGSTPAWFLGDFDRGPRFYSLGRYSELEGVITYFAGSHERTSLAARSGFNVSSIFSPLWVNREFCGPDEAPLACEYRVHKPAIAFIMLGTNDVFHPEDFEPGMRRIIEFSMENGVIPILTTKADNQEGDGRINATLASLALEYDVPLWNYWRAVQDLPNQGLQEDGAHLTWGPNRFDDPEAMEKAWTIRNLTALQALDAVWRAIQ